MKKAVKFIALCLVLFVASTAIVCAQSEQGGITVTSFKELPNDMTARVTDKKLDQNGDVAAIIKVVTPAQGFTADNGMLGIVDMKYDVGELWVYVPHGTIKLTLKHQKYGVLRDYYFDIPIKEATVYEMNIKIHGFQYGDERDETPSTQYFVMNYTPANIDAELYVDDVYYPASGGSVSLKLDRGEHTYRLQAPKYFTEAGVVEILTDKVEKSVALRPTFTAVEFISAPENGAEVYIDGEKIGTTPFIAKDMAFGDYTISVKHPYYLPSTQTIKVEENPEGMQVQVPLKSNSAYITVVPPDGAEITVNDQRESNFGANHRLRLLTGNYTIKATKDGHKSTVYDLQVVAGNDQTIRLNAPTPIYGSLDISTGAISGATIYVDGVKSKSKTPDIVKNILEGNHKITVEKDGYAQVVEYVTIKEKETTSLVVELKKKEKASNQITNSKPKETSKKVGAKKKSDNGILLGVEYSPMLKYSYLQYDYEVAQYGLKLGYSFGKSTLYGKFMFGASEENGGVKVERDSYLVGYSYSAASWLSIGAGAGLGSVVVKDNDVIDINHTSYEVELGLSIHYAGFYFGYSAASFEFKNLEHRIGIGMIF